MLLRHYLIMFMNIHDLLLKVVTVKVQCMQHGLFGI